MVNTSNDRDKGPYDREEIEGILTRHNAHAGENRIMLAPQVQDKHLLHFSGNAEAIRALSSQLFAGGITKVEDAHTGHDQATLKVFNNPGSHGETNFNLVLSTALQNIRKEAKSLQKESQAFVSDSYCNASSRR